MRNLLTVMDVSRLLMILLMFKNSVVFGTKCNEDLKLYIVQLSLEKQFQHLFLAKINCLNLIEQEKNKTEVTDSYCERVFDGIMCWERTKAGTVAEQGCPDYINKFHTRGIARRKCLSTGEWYINPTTNETYTDFSGCSNYSDIEEPQSSGVVKHVERVRILYTVGYAISFASLLFAIFLMLWFRKLHCQRNTIHINLFISFILRAVIVFVKDMYHTPDGVTKFENDKAVLETVGSNWPCKLIYSLFHYILITNYMWIFVEGLYLHTLIFFSTFKTTKLFYFCILFGWISPLVSIIPWVIMRRLYEDSLCWSTHVNKLDWILKAQMLLSIITNFFFFINIIRVLFTKLTASNARDTHKYRKLARSTLVLIPLFGIYYVVFLIVALKDCKDETVEIVWLYTESFVNSCQGFVVALLFCFLNGEVRAEVRKIWKRHMLRRVSTVSFRSMRTMSVGSSVFTREKSSHSLLFTDVSKDNSVVMGNGTSIIRDSDSNVNTRIKFDVHSDIPEEITDSTPMIEFPSNSGNSDEQS